MTLSQRCSQRIAAPCEVDDPYLDPATGVLRNRLGIDDPEEFAQLEAELAAIRIAEVARNPLPGLYDLDHLRRFHRAIFRDVYLWAGEVRTVDIRKGPVPFCLAEHIQAEANRIFGLVGEARPVDESSIPGVVAELLGEINSLHPFREGNGRAQRSFLRQWLAEYGWEVDFAGMDPDQNVAACEAALVEVDYEPLERLLGPRLRRR